METRGGLGGQRAIDDPIGAPDEDLLDRAPFASALARQIVAAPRGRSTVAAVIGPWGEGKTSVLNMARHHIAALAADTIFVQFNPWLFEGTEELVRRFLDELGSTLSRADRLDRRLSNKADKALADYGEVFGRLGSAAQGKRQRRTAYDARDAVRDVLRKLNRRVVVVVDDIDRLTAPEIRDVMRLVKLVADFPDMVFVLAFDRNRVEQALGETFGNDAETEASEGRAYLDKIVQVAADLPDISRPRLMELLAADLADVLGRLGREVPADSRWPQTLGQVIAPLLRNLRDVRRYLASVGLAVELVGDEVDLGDVLALEALRIFAPEAWRGIAAHAETLTSPAPLDLGNPDPREEARKRELEEWLSDQGERRPLLAAALDALFPATHRILDDTSYGREGEREWRRTRRVAHAQNLRFYFAKVHGPQVIANEWMDALVDALADEQAAKEMLQGLARPRLGIVLRRLRDYPEIFSARHAEAASTTLLSVIDRLPAVSPMNMGLDDQGLLMGYVGGLLEAAEPDDRPAIYKRLYDEAPSLSARWLVLSARRPGDDQRRLHIDEDEHGRLTAAFERQLIDADADALLLEQHLDHLFHVLIRSEDGRAHVRIVGADDRLLGRLLGDLTHLTYDDAHRHSMPWDALARGFGREWLERRIADLERAESPDERVRHAIEVARHYLDHGTGLPATPSA